MLEVINQHKSAQAIKSNKNVALFKLVIAEKLTVKYLFLLESI